MKNIKKVFNYITWIPFAVSIGAFILYLRYYFQIGIAANSVVSAQVNLIMDRYLKVGLFSLFIGLVILFINRISKLIFNEDKYYEEKYPWMNEKNNIKTLEEEFRENASKEIEEKVIKKEDYVIQENYNSDEQIQKDMKDNKVLKARFIDGSKEEKMLEILTDEDEELEVLSLDNVVLMPEVKRQTVIKVDSSKVRIDGFKKCPKCGNLLVDEAVICVHCGILLDESLKTKKIVKKEENYVKVKQKKKFNSVRFAINSIIILLGLIAIILMCNKIQEQKKINESKMTMKTTVEKINK